MWPPFGRHNSNSAWEVVDAKSTEPVCVYDNPDELPILRVASENVNVSCTYDVRPPPPGDKVRSPVSAALLSARGRLLREAARAGYNVLLVEGWSVTLQRRSHFHAAPAHPTAAAAAAAAAPFRLSVHYTGRPAFLRGAHLGTRPPPPFFGMLQDWGVQVEREYLAAPPPPPPPPPPDDSRDRAAQPQENRERTVCRSASRLSRALRAPPPPRSPSPRDVKRRVARGGVKRGWRRSFSNVLRIIHL
ncbi:hypothetical protein DAEQUDRAFT_8326 [Daedalea quercina L-15889]|uniref:Uncharacterized protein n=1 Tax=Daedalea quercina L-15889 TaxID=1314783 RepID=A0A165UFA5_9APHY|nr:hypothetical protein DAEQUDRAFT_8326 [Daedalea quercina L-15889]